MQSSHPPILVVGAGPSGLMAGAALRRRGLPCRIVDAGRKPGGIWDIDRERTPMYESAHFISSRSVSGLPDFPMPETYPDYPSHDRIQAYIESYATHHDLVDHITFGVRVEEATRVGEGRWRVRLDSGEEIEASALVVATGMTWYPRMPELAGRFEGEEMHSFDYRSPDLFSGKRVLVVGGGNSGVDIACDAARHARSARISLRRGYHFIPKHIFGVPADVFAHSGPTMPTWLEERIFGLLVGRLLVGDLERYGLQRPDHPILRSHPIMNTQLLHHLSHGDIEARRDVTSIDGAAVSFADGVQESFDLIVWATGYAWRFPFLRGEDREPVEELPDLYLNVFSRRYPDLFFLGVFETDGAAYPLIGKQAELVGAWLERRRDGGDVGAFDERRRTHRPDLRGGRRYVRSPRHDVYVRGAVYQAALDRALREVGAA